MNLGELRLKALQSLKRPYISPLPSPTFKTEQKEPKELTPPETPIPETLKLTETDREEGEITDEITEEEEDEKSSSDSTDHEWNGDHRNSNYSNNNYPRFDNSNNHKKPKYNRTSCNTWTRKNVQSDDEPDLESFKDLDSLTAFKTNILRQLDESQALFAASEDHEQDLLLQLRDCRALQHKCEKDRYRNERILEKIDWMIKRAEMVEDKVSGINFKKVFVGKMYKETYLRSLPGFADSLLYRTYSEILVLNPKTLCKKVDVMLPCCLTELTDGKCPYREESCTMQHLL